MRQNCNYLEIDGSQGEGGGQILRSSLSLATVSQQPIRVSRIRAGRERPGLLRQHLTAVRAAAEVCNASVTGAELGSQELCFKPQSVVAGEYQFAVGSAGSAILVAQTVLPALMLCDKPSRVQVEGGTHNDWAPPFEFFERCFLPQLRKLGPQVQASIERYGFFPAGGGKLHLAIEPCKKLGKLELTDRISEFRPTKQPWYPNCLNPSAKESAM